MVYLGVVSPTVSPVVSAGVYRFYSSGICSTVAGKIVGSTIYTSESDALSAFSISSTDILDGGILVKKYCPPTRNVSYLGINNSPFAGVYYFNVASACKKLADSFDGSVMTSDKDSILSQFNITEADIKDGGFLYSNKVKSYLTNKSKNIVGSKISVVDVNTRSLPTNEINYLKSILGSLKSVYDVAEIKMSTGDIYRLALRDIFYMTYPDALKDCAYMLDSVPVIKSDIVDSLIKSGIILSLCGSNISYLSNMICIENCDDAYSPTISAGSDGCTTLSHSISSVYINTNQIVSVVGKVHYDELNYFQITKKSQRLAYTYLRGLLKKV